MAVPICYTFGRSIIDCAIMHRRALFALLLALPLSVSAQLRLEPLPEPPPPPPGVTNAPGDQSVTISSGPADQVEEFVVDGQRSLKVTTPDGSVYYLMQDQRDGGVRQSTDTGLRVPLWVIKQF